MSKRGIITKALEKIRRNTVSREYIDKNFVIVNAIHDRLYELNKSVEWLDQKTGYKGSDYRFDGKYNFTLKELVAIENCLDIKIFNDD